MLAINQFKHTENKQYYYQEHEIRLRQTQGSTGCKGRDGKQKKLYIKAPFSMTFDTSCF